MKKSVALVLVVVLCAAFALAGCSGTPATESSSAPESSAAESPAAPESSAETAESSAEAPASSEAAADGEKVLGLICINLNLPFYVDMITAGDQAAEDYGVQTIWKSAEGSIDNEIALIDGFIEQGVDCILVDPIDVIALEPAIDRAYKAGIPTITMGNIVAGDGNVNTIYPDERDCYAISQLMGYMLGGEGEVAFMIGTPGNYVSDTRQLGFERGLEDFPDMTHQLLVSDYDTNTGLQAAQDCMASTPDLKGMTSVSDNVSVAAMQVLGPDVKIFSHDGDPTAIELVKEGKFECTVLTGAKRVGYWNIVVGAALANGEDVPTNVYLPTYWIVSDAAQKVIDENNIGADMDIVSADEGMALSEGYREEFAPGNYTIS